MSATFFSPWLGYYNFTAKAGAVYQHLHLLNSAQYRTCDKKSKYLYYNALSNKFQAEWNVAKINSNGKCILHRCDDNEYDITFIVCIVWILF